MAGKLIFKGRIRFTKTRVESLPFAEAGQEWYLDDTLPGFGLCIGKATKTYFAEGSMKGRSIRLTIGRAHLIAADNARKEAKNLLGQMAKGIDPRNAKIKDITLQTVFDDYLKARKSLKPKTIYGYNSAMKLHFSDWLKRPVHEISRKMVEKRHIKLKEKPGKRPDKVGNATADGAMVVLRAVLNFACDEGHIPENPVKLKKRWYGVQPRTSYIKKHELPAWFKAVMELDHPTGRDYLLLLLFTGMRRNEAATLKWSDIDFEGRTLTVRDTKNKKPLILPLSDFLFNLLKQRQENYYENDYVFPGSGKGGYLVEPRRFVLRVAAASGVAFRPHDLRRTFLTIAESLEIPHFALKALVNHSTRGDVTAGYIQVTPDRLRKPMQQITNYILLTAREERGKVIPLRIV